MIVANAAIGKSWARLATDVIVGLCAGSVFLLGALDLVGAPLLSSGLSAGAKLGLDLGTMATGVAAAAVATRFGRDRLSRVLPIDPESPVHALALALVVILFGTQLASTAFTDVLASERALPPLTVGDLVIQEVPFLVLALAGVGLFMRRNGPEIATRLGVVAPGWWQVVLALAAAGLFFVFGQQMDVLSHQLSPSVARQVDATTEHLFGGMGGPAGIAALALAPGICEEILFRGALQPRIGLLATALLFTSIHTQYGLTLDAFSVFVIALGLGLIRKYANTTTSSLCHVTYNLVTGIGIAGAAVGPAVAIEALLVTATAYSIWTRRRRQAAPSGS
ncbi:MAG: type II CAAX prenyl endopeptidase Rce1 family protein [Candidatus Dormibacterales bacterium]